MSRRVTAIATLVALVLAGPPVRAAPPPSGSEYDTVVLRDGAVLRGTIVQATPGQDIVIKTALGETRTIPWSEVASTAWAGASVPQDSMPAGPQDPVPGDMSDEVPPGPSRPRVYIETTGRGEAHLFELGAPALTTSGSRYGRAALLATARLVCRAPCGRVIDGSEGNAFFFGGDRLIPSRPFYLKDLEGEFVARVRPGHRGLLFGGVALAGFGYAGTLSGVLLVALTREDTQKVGGIVLGAGLAMLIGGIVMGVRSVTRYRLSRR